MAIKSVKIKYKKPMLWWVVKMFFPNVEWGRTVFTFGDTIYAPRIMPKHLEVHEMVHVEQMHCSKFVACINFIMFWLFPWYRLRREIPAYQAEWEIIKDENKYSDRVHYFKKHLAETISSPLYGNMITYEEALKLFK